MTNNISRMPDKVSVGKPTIASAGRAEALARTFARQIASGEWAVGALLPPERDLALQIGVSRTVVREATKWLQARGLVESRQGSGTVVVGLSTQPVRELYEQAMPESRSRHPKLLEARRGLEIQIAGLAAQRSTAEDVSEMSEQMEAFAAAGDDIDECARLDVAFHASLAKATHNDIFGLMLEPLVDLLMESRVRSLQNSHHSVALSHHRAILESVVARLPDEAALRMKEHIHIGVLAFEWRVEKG